MSCLRVFFTTVFVPRDVLLVKGKGGEKIATFRIYFEVVSRLVAASHSRGTKPPCWRANVALRQDKQKANIILDNNCLCLSCPSVTFALQHGGFVPREWLAAKGLLAMIFFSQLFLVTVPEVVANVH